MAWEHFEARQGLRSCILGLAAVAAALTITSDAADARHFHRSHVHIVRHTIHLRAHGGGEYSPPTASIIVDGNSGQVLEESNPDALRHPASLTKVMTLYLLFEQLDAGKLRLDSPLRVSEHAAEQDPTKLGLKAGQTIAVEDAIKGIVTRSANDAAVVIAENLGGDEAHFAKLMTQKAHELGMSRTTYVNASGLPDDDQITTAHDQALLGRAMEDRFPRYYKFFSTTSFVFRGETIRGHDHLLGSMDGVDGMKTGFTRASGFNLLTSLHRDGRYVIGVVMGGTSAASRDEHMRELIEAHLKMASVHRTAPLIADRIEPKREAQQVASAKDALAKDAIAARADPTATASVPKPVKTGSTDPIKPLLVRTISYHTVPVHASPSLAPMPALVAVPAPAPSPAAAQSQQLPQPLAVNPPGAVVASADPDALPLPAPEKSEPPPPMQRSSDAEPAATIVDLPPTPQAHLHGGWLIQIGAFDGEDEAKQHLNDAQLKLHTVLGAADPFTERVQKGDKAFFRARFAGFDKASAEAACRELKRSDIECMALKD